MDGDTPTMPASCAATWRYQIESSKGKTMVGVGSAVVQSHLFPYNLPLRLLCNNIEPMVCASITDWNKVTLP